MLLFWFLSFAIAWAITLPPMLVHLGVLSSAPAPYSLAILIGVAPIIAAAIAAAAEHEGGRYWISLRRLPKPAWPALVAVLLPPALLAAT